MRRQADVEAFFERERPEYVILAAAKVGGILANSTYTAEFIYDNIIIAANVVQCAYRYGVKKAPQSWLVLYLPEACASTDQGRIPPDGRA